MILETALSIRARLVILQEPFIRNREISHGVFNFYWPQGNRTEIRVMIAIRKDLLDKIVVEHRIDLLTYFYSIFLEIRDSDQQLKRPGRKTRVLNIYNNQVRQGYTWTGNTL